MSPVRATKRGEERTPLEGARADVLICGASFAGLAVARELARRAPDADVLVVDRYEIGERATSACAAPTPWLHAMGVARSIRAELGHMTFSTPHGTARYRLPWSWSSFDYRVLCAELWAQAGAARFETAKVERHEREPHGGHVVHTDRGAITAPLVVDALGWRRVLADPHFQPPEAPLSRGLEVHPHVDAAGSDDALDCWVDRSLVRHGYGWRVPAGGEARIGIGSYDPRRHVKEGTVALAGRLEAEPVRYQGNWFPHRLRPATEDGVFFCGDSAGHCLPLSGEGIRTAFAFGISAGEELAGVLTGAQTPEAALAAHHARSARLGRFSARLLRLQRVLPQVPPRVLTLAFRALGWQPVVDRAFGWYLEAAHPRLASPSPEPAGRRARPRG